MKPLSRLVAEFEAHTLPKEEWTHAAHLAVGLWYVKRALDDATRRVRDGIRAYNEACGVANTDTSGYHETITRVFLAAVAEQVATHPDATLAELLESLLASDAARSDFPLRFYSRERLFSKEARRAWVEPDLKPLA